MVKAYATLTSKGQLTLPRAVRDAWRLKPGDRVAFEIDGKNRGRIEPVRRRSIFEDIEKLSIKLSEPLTQEDIDRAIDDGAADRVLGKAGSSS